MISLSINFTKINKYQHFLLRQIIYNCDEQVMIVYLLEITPPMWISHILNVDLVME